MDRKVFIKRVLAMEDRMYRVSFGILRNRQDQMDAIQEAVIRAWENIGRLQKEEYFETWLTRILINRCYDLLNARGRSVPLEQIAECPAPETTNRELRDAIRSLAPDLRLLIVLHYMEGYKLREIAAMLKLPVNTVSTRLLRARKKLREALEDRGE